MLGGLERDVVAKGKKDMYATQRCMWIEDRSRTGLYLLEYIAVYLDSLYIYVHNPLTKSKIAFAVWLPELMMWMGAVCGQL